MSQRIIYVNQDGGISVVIPSGELSLDEVISKDVPEGADYSIVDALEIPSDREFRNAWEKNGSLVQVNIEKAKEVKKDNLRLEREPLLKQLDVDFIKALEASDSIKQQEISEKKQELRDITKIETLLNATTVEELKAIKIVK